MDFFTTRMMLRMLEQTYPAQTFFRDTFFKNRVILQEEKVDLDIRKGTRRVATYVNRKIGHTIVERQGYTMQTIQPQLIAPMMITTAEDVIKRSAGENIYGAKNPNERLIEILARDMRTLDDMIARAEELQCAQALYTGKIVMPVTDGDGHVVDVITVDYSDNWNFDKVNWEDVTTSNPSADFRRWRRTITKNSGLNADIAIVGANALEWLYLSLNWREEQKFIQTNFANYTPKNAPLGATFVGLHPSLGIEMFTIDEWVLDAVSGEEVPLADPNMILIGSTDAYTSLIYGMIYDVAIGSFAAARVPKSFVRDEPSARFLKLSSAPIAVPHQTDAFLSITVCTKGPTGNDKKLVREINEAADEASKDMIDKSKAKTK